MLETEKSKKSYKVVYAPPMNRTVMTKPTIPPRPPMNAAAAGAEGPIEEDAIANMFKRYNFYFADVRRNISF